MIKKNGIMSLGEALIDFIPLDKENITYQKSPGGAPANVAVGVARLGAKSTFLGKVGDDVLGRFLLETLQSYQVNTRAMILTDEARTGVVFVTLAENGERSFEFFITPSADVFLREEEVKEDLFKENKVFHFGSISLIHDPVRTATKKAVRLAKENGIIVSYDPNLRLSLWNDEDIAKETILAMMSEVDVVKISEEELEFLTGETDMDAGIAAMKSYNIPVLVITLGEKGSYAVVKGEKAYTPAMKVEAVDTTGAGDAFVSGLLYCLNEYVGTISNLTVEVVAKMTAFASVSGALAASEKGAMTALPTIEKVREHLEMNGIG